MFQFVSYLYVSWSFLFIFRHWRAAAMLFRARRRRYSPVARAFLSYLTATTTGHFRVFTESAPSNWRFNTLRNLGPSPQDSLYKVYPPEPILITRNYLIISLICNVSLIILKLTLIVRMTIGHFEITLLLLPKCWGCTWAWPLDCRLPHKGITVKGPVGQKFITGIGPL